jgi:hypothetical protein
MQTLDPVMFGLMIVPVELNGEVTYGLAAEIPSCVVTVTPAESFTMKRYRSAGVSQIAALPDVSRGTHVELGVAKA